jgi:uncharacterized membrane protein
MVVAALAGFADASFIAFKHFQGEIPPCSVLNGCENVLTSKYSSIGPVRLEWLGIAYYLTIFILIVTYLDTGKSKFVFRAVQLTVIGLLTSIVLVGLQVFVLDSLCLYCLISAATSIVLFTSGAYILSIQEYN